MQAMFFGSPGKQLFGVYYAPQGQPRDYGVVLCNPLGLELSHTCRCSHHLAMLLARAGFAAFRFDYFGTGDSAGGAEEGSMSQWLKDIHSAVAELRGFGCKRLALVGLRFGATLAALYAQENDDVDLLVLWEPLVKGEDYIRNWRRLHEMHFTNAGFECPPTEEEMLGQPFPNRLREGIGAIHLKGAFGDGPRVLVIEHGANRSALSPSLLPEMQRSAQLFDLEVTDAPPFWEDSRGLAFVPRPLLERIVRWLSSAQVVQV